MKYLYNEEIEYEKLKAEVKELNEYINLINDIVNSALPKISNEISKIPEIKYVTNTNNALYKFRWSVDTYRDYLLKRKKEILDECHKKERKLTDEIVKRAMKK